MKPLWWSSVTSMATCTRWLWPRGDGATAGWPRRPRSSASWATSGWLCAASLMAKGTGRWPPVRRSSWTGPARLSTGSCSGLWRRCWAPAP